MIEQFKAVADALLQKHYGVDIYDTDLADDEVVARFLAEGRRPFEAVNVHAGGTRLGRIDMPLQCEELSLEPLTLRDEAVLAGQAYANQSCLA